MITGAGSGVGQALSNTFAKFDWTVHGYTRSDLDLNNLDAVLEHDVPTADVLVHCAAHDLDGKTPFLSHNPESWTSIINVNLTSVMLLTHKMLNKNPRAKIVLITSTNNNGYWPNDLVYSLTKQSMATFGHMLTKDHPECRCLEVRLGLTRTNFNHNRYRQESWRYQDIYQNPHLEAMDVADRVYDAIQDDHVKLLEIAP
jgi:NADP-dependent 3-hydroxy acid dehydrogenase YdfG